MGLGSPIMLTYLPTTLGCLLVLQARVYNYSLDGIEDDIVWSAEDAYKASKEDNFTGSFYRDSACGIDQRDLVAELTVNKGVQCSKLDFSKKYMGQPIFKL